MKGELRGFEKVFSFTFISHIKSKGYRNTTIGVGILCLIIPIVVLGIMAFQSGDDIGQRIPESQPSMESENAGDGLAGAEEGMTETEKLETTENLEVSKNTEADIQNADIREIFFVDRSPNGFKEMLDFGIYADEVMAAKGKGDFEEFSITSCGDDLEKARKASYGKDDALVIVLEKVDNKYEAGILIPQESKLKEENVAWVDVLLGEYSNVVMENRKQSAEQSEQGSESEPGEQGSDDFALMTLTFINIMFMYFFVLIYAQGVSTSVIMEKTSKLMEFFLISVKPSAMILGKLLAITLAGIVQLFSWIFMLLIGLIAGDLISGLIDESSGSMLYEILDIIRVITENRFTFGGTVVAMLIAAAGILLYCSLAGICGALASKQEDLASTNILFTLVLIASYFAALFGGGIEGFGAKVPWLSECLDWIPFTAVLVLPARLLTGIEGVAVGLISLAEILITTMLFICIGGRLYKATVLYRGKIPAFREIMKMITSK